MKTTSPERGRRVSRASALVCLLVPLMLALLYSMAKEFRVFASREGISAAARLLFFDSAVTEFLLMLGGLALLVNGRRYFRFAAYALTLGLALIYVIQLLVLQSGGKFLTRLAVENIPHAEYVVGFWTVLGMVLLTASLIAAVVYIERKLSPWGSSPKKKWVVAYVLILVSIFALKEAAPRSVAEGRKVLLNRVNLRHSSPVWNFVKVWKTPLRFLGVLSPEEIAEIKKYGFSLDPEPPYPFLREKIYETPPPFGDTALSAGSKTNVILFFMEGVSARSLEIYRRRYPGLTPNFSRFSKSAMVVDKYWNHTAASYRGMKGQLCSMYPLYDGAGVLVGDKELDDINYFCLPHLFREIRYETTFLNAHRRHESFVDEMMPNLGFHSVWNAEELSKTFLKGEPIALSASLSDHQFFRSVRGWLEKSKTDPRPFFLSGYNMGTHAFFDVHPDEPKYGDGSNNALNTIHNLDHALGEFLDYFENSPQAKNTVIFLTADHCHYTEPSFVKAFDDRDYPNIFVDRIPLLIYDPRVKLPARFDATNQTSISLAPTMAHYLGLPNGKNPFFGRSLFETARKQYSNRGVAWYLRNFLVIDDDKIENYLDPDDPDIRRRAIRRYFQFSGRMETENRIWSPYLRDASASHLR
jgi:lipoteichoic acid synthase